MSKVVKSAIDGKSATWTVSNVEAQIQKLTERLANIKNTPDGVKNYVNIIYNKTAIDNNPALFKDIIKDFLIRKGITMNEAKLATLVEDLSGHFPFVRFEKRSWDKMLVKIDAVKNGGIKELNEIVRNERFLFNRQDMLELVEQDLWLHERCNLKLQKELLVMIFLHYKKHITDKLFQIFY